MTNERLEILRDVPSSEYGGCSFCTERPDVVTVIGGKHPMRHGAFRLCAACRAELSASLQDEPKASQLHDRENRCVLCHKYRNEGAISCANCGLDFSLNRNGDA
jgi:hypothetical protein